MRHQATKNRDEGAVFEGLFKSQCQRLGLTVFPNYHSCRLLPRRYGSTPVVKVVPGNLDFHVISQTGQVGFFDCKSFGDDSFIYSKLNAHQVDRAAAYNALQVAAGFVVWLRALGRVFFYSGSLVRNSGPGSRFFAKDGVDLGVVTRFNLAPIMSVSRQPLVLTIG